MLVFDEVMTGFGRTGDWFSSLKSEVCPDMICLAKGLTGGFLPLAVTVCSQEVYQAFYSDDPMKTFFHGHSYTANPLGCAAAIASLQLLEENQHLFKEMEIRHRIHLDSLANHPKLHNVRCMGTIAAMNILSNKAVDYLNPLSKRVRLACFEEGLLVRPLGNVLYLMPPYCITDAELEKCYRIIRKVLDAL